MITSDKTYTHTHTHTYTHIQIQHILGQNVLVLFCCWEEGGGHETVHKKMGRWRRTFCGYYCRMQTKKKKKEKAAIWIIYLSGRYGRNKGQKQIPRSPPQTDSFHGIDWVWPDLFSLFFLEIFFFFSFPSSHTCFFSLPPFIREWRIWVSSWPVSVCPGWFSSRRFCAI